MTCSKLPLLTIGLLIVLLLSCKEDDEEFTCFPDTVDTSITVTKENVDCEEIDLVWEVSFGVNLKVSTVSQCAGSCDDSSIGYTYRLMRNRLQQSDTLQGGITFFSVCGDTRSFTNTLNTELGDPQEYFVGDTIIYEIDRYQICPTPNADCEFLDFVPLEGTPVRTSYILDESDFCG